ALSAQRSRPLPRAVEARAELSLVVDLVALLRERDDVLDARPERDRVRSVESLDLRSCAVAPARCRRLLDDVPLLLSVRRSPSLRPRHCGRPTISSPIIPRSACSRMWQ